MGSDLAALTPPLIVCAAFLLGLLWFLRRQMAPARRPADDEDGADIEADQISEIGAELESPTDSEASPAGDPRRSSQG